MEFKQYRRSQIAELRPYVPGEDMSDISVSLVDHEAGSPKPGDIFIDIGANCGWFTLNAARAVGPKGFVLAIEPQPTMVERLRFNVGVNDFNDRVHISPCAVSDTPGNLAVYVNPKQRGMTGVDANCGTERKTIPAATLPELLAATTAKQAAVLKIDIEGYEDRALLPMIWAMDANRWPRKIFMETRHADRWASPCVEILCQHGYSVVWHDKGDALLSL